MLTKALELSVSRLIDESAPRILGSFGKVHLLDSTRMSLPEELSEIWKGSGGSASDAGMKFHLMLDYKRCKSAILKGLSGIGQLSGFGTVLSGLIGL